MLTDNQMENVITDRLSIGQCASLACLLEVTAPKPGNVHRGADFHDLTFTDFAASAVAIAPVMDSAVETPLGRTILHAVRATRQVVNTNTNLGTVLLLAPLATVPRKTPLERGIGQILGHLTHDDARNVYQAIRLASPGGMGRVAKDDIQGTAPDDLLRAMQHVADQDLVARQYVNDFDEVLGKVVPMLLEESRISLADRIIRTQLQLLREFPDGLIVRKCGINVARQASIRASRVLDSGSPGDKNYHSALADLDFWLRSDNNRRNPGTTADLIAAGLFVALRDERLTPPF